jgi:hypothetical protein
LQEEQVNAVRSIESIPTGRAINRPQPICKFILWSNWESTFFPYSSWSS